MEGKRTPLLLSALLLAAFLSVGGAFAAPDTIAAEITRTQYIWITAGSAGGALVVMIIILIIRLSIYKRKLKAYNAAVPKEAAPELEETVESSEELRKHIDDLTVKMEKAPTDDDKLNIALERITLNQKLEDSAVVEPPVAPAPPVQPVVDRAAEADVAFEAVSAVVKTETAVENAKREDASYKIARRKAEIVTLRGKLRTAETEREALAIRDNFNTIALSLDSDELESAELKSLLARSIEEASRAAAVIASRNANRVRRTSSAPRAENRPRRAPYEERRRYDEYGRPYIERVYRVYGDEASRRAIDRDRAEKERLYRERQRRLRERNDNTKR